MRSVILIVLAIMTVSPPALAIAVPEEETVLHADSLLMTKLIDGKRSDRDMVVDISVVRSGGKYTVMWDAVYITALTLPNEVKRTHLRAKHYGTDTGNIKNIVVEEKFITFTIVRSHGDMSHGDLKVDIFWKGEFGFDIEVKAYGTRRSQRRQQDVTEEWVMSDDVKLPSREISGYPDKKPKKR